MDKKVWKRNGSFKFDYVSQLYLLSTYYKSGTVLDAVQNKDPLGDFPGSPVSRTQHFHCRGLSFNPWLRELRSCNLHNAAKKKKKTLLEFIF